MAYGLISGQSMILPTLTNPAQPNQLLTGTQLINQDKELVVGTMPNRGTITQTLIQQGQQYTIPQGYHSGSGKITARFSNLTAGNVRDGVNIGGVVGTYNGEVDFLELVDSVTKRGGSYTGTSTNLIEILKATDIVQTDCILMKIGSMQVSLSYNGNTYDSTFPGLAVGFMGNWNNGWQGSQQWVGFDGAYWDTDPIYGWSLRFDNTPAGPLRISIGWSGPLNISKTLKWSSFKISTYKFSQ